MAVCITVCVSKLYIHLFLPRVSSRFINPHKHTQKHGNWNTNTQSSPSRGYRTEESPKYSYVFISFQIKLKLLADCEKPLSVCLSVAWLSGILEARSRLKKRHLWMKKSITVTATKTNSTLLLQLHFFISSQLWIKKLLGYEISRAVRKMAREQWAGAALSISCYTSHG